MTEASVLDLTLISFIEDPAVCEVLEVSSRLAQELRSREGPGSRRPEEAAAAARDVREMHLTDIVHDSADRSRMASMVFHVADSLAAANLTAAWHGLSGVPAALALSLSGHDALDLPLAVATSGPPSGWLLVRPLVLANEPAGAWLPHGRTLVELDQVPVGDPITGLLGFPHGAVNRIDGGAHRGCRRFTLNDVAQERLLDVSYALLSGLLSGALRRVVEEAYAYARTRNSAGKPINQHQAVMLRLAELALRQQSMALYLQATAERQPEIGCQGRAGINVDHIAWCAGWVAEDAVQVAAGHGYVEGLPFRRLFEQIRTLASAIALLLEGIRGVRTNEATQGLS